MNEESVRPSLLTLHYTSVVPYFILMALFMLVAYAIQRTVPFYKRALAQEISDRSHFLQLDGLRGILALAVFFTHSESFHYRTVSGHWALPPSHFYAQLAVAPVAMFFLITGFLFWTKAQKGNMGRLTTFFKHRIRRLLPAYLLLLVIILLFALHSTHFRLAVSLPNLLHSLLSDLSFGLISGPTLNGYQDANLISNMIWSLRAEWMFYIALPLLALLAGSWRKQIFLPILSVTCYFLLPVLRAHIPAIGVGTIQYFNRFLLSYFLVGMLISYFKLRHSSNKFLTGPIATIAAIVLLAAMLQFFPLKESLLEGLAVGFPLLLIVFGNSFFGLLRFAPLVFLGQISYSTYLLHMVVLFTANKLLLRYAVRPLTPLEFWLFTALNGMVVVCVAAASYRWLEAPFMHGYGTLRASPEPPEKAPSTNPSSANA